MRDPYDILGVARGASHDEIKKAYRKLAKELHPDRNQGNQKIAERFKEVSAAYGIVGDETQRGRYDRGEIDAQGNEKPQFHNFRRGPGANHRAGAGAGRGRQQNPFEGMDFGGDDPFADFFTNMGGGGGRRGPARGADRKYTLKVGFLEAARGGKRRVTLGDGKTLDITIPAEIDSGQTIRLKGQGDPSPVAGGTQGDALIEIEIETHPYLSRKGDDVHLDLPVTLKEAVLGAKVTAPTIHGTVALTVPKGANTGTALRLKGKGFAKHGGGHGDQIVRLRVMLPDAPDPALEKAIEGWKGGNYEVRQGIDRD